MLFRRLTRWSLVCGGRPIQPWAATLQARSSVAERCRHTAEAGGSIPSAPRRLRGSTIAAVLATALSVMLSACTNQAGSVSATAATPPSHAEMNSDYVIGPGDTLSIFVYENPQLSVGSLPVRPDGRISTPLVPDVTAAGLTPTQLAQVLTERLSKYEKSPVVTVMVMGFIGPTDRQIRVIGEAAD